MNRKQIVLFAGVMTACLCLTSTVRADSLRSTETTAHANSQSLTDQSRAVAQKFWRGIQAGFSGEPVDIEDIMSILADDFVWRIPETLPNPWLEGKEQARKRFLYDISGGFYDPKTTRLKFINWVAEGDSVALQFTVEGTLLANGKPYRNYYMAMMRVRDGLLAECIETYDTALQFALMRKYGMHDTLKFVDQSDRAIKAFE